MRQINYQDWADYIMDIKEGCNIKSGKALEIGGGLCYIADKLFNNFEHYVVSDLSQDMLLQNDNKFLDKVCCNMTALPFKEKFDFIFSTFDCVNYLTEEHELLNLFKEVSQVLSDSGIFTFDVSLENNSYKNVKSLNRKGRHEGLKYIQKSRYDSERRIHTNEFKIFLDNKEIIEIHEQKIYPFEKIFEIIEDSGMYVLDCFESFTFEDADDESERVQFVVKKEV